MFLYKGEVGIGTVRKAIDTGTYFNLIVVTTHSLPSDCRLPPSSPTCSVQQWGRSGWPAPGVPEHAPPAPAARGWTRAPPPPPLLPHQLRLPIPCSESGSGAPPQMTAQTQKDTCITLLILRLNWNFTTNYVQNKREFKNTENVFSSRIQDAQCLGSGPFFNRNGIRLFRSFQNPDPAVYRI